MNPLCISNINLRSPYAVWEEKMASMFSFLKITFFML